MRSHSETPVYIISAERPQFSKEENHQRTQGLQARLTHRFGKDKIKRVRGKYRGIREMAFVVNGSQSALADIARAYDQESILHLDTSRNATLLFEDGREEKIGQMVAVEPAEALAADAFTYDISQNTYYIIK